MTAIVLTVLMVAALFAGFGLMNRGKEEKRRCGSCHGCADPDQCDAVLRELK